MIRDALATDVQGGVFLARMERLMSRAEFCAVIEPHYLAKVGELLMANGMRLSGGSIVDATLVAAPPSINNRDKTRYPEMHQTKKETSGISA